MGIRRFRMRNTMKSLKAMNQYFILSDYYLFTVRNVLRVAQHGTRRRLHAQQIFAEVPFEQYRKSTRHERFPDEMNRVVQPDVTGVAA